ncbi:hypothetical protein SAMN02746062_01356, partial [Alysiella filiformis DSM 16848]
MASYTLKVIHNGQTEQMLLANNHGARVRAEKNTQYQLFDENGRLIEQPLVEQIGNDLWVYAKESDGMPELVLQDFVNQSPIWDWQQVVQSGNSLMTGGGDVAAATLPETVAAVKASQVASTSAAGLSGGQVAALAGLAALGVGAAVAGGGGGSDKANETNASNTPTAPSNPATPSNPTAPSNPATPNTQ